MSRDSPPPRPVIRLVTHTALSGPLTPYADVARGARAYFGSVNQAGGVHGADIDLLIVDSKDDPATTRAEIERLVEGGEVFGLFQPIGDPGQRAILDYLDERGVPTFFMGSGLSLYTQPFRGKVFVSNPAYKDFGRELARYAASHPYGKQRIGLVYLERESGREFAEGVKEVLGAGGTLVHTEAVTFEAALAPVVERLRSQGVDTVIPFLLPAAVLEAIQAGKERGYAPRFMSNFMDLLIEQGGAMSRESSRRTGSCLSGTRRTKRSSTIASSSRPTLLACRPRP
jgi:ABC-type branched-subunit amino acid transport system substrate-binding protein